MSKDQPKLEIKLLRLFEGGATGLSAIIGLIILGLACIVLLAALYA